MTRDHDEAKAKLLNRLLMHVDDLRATAAFSDGMGLSVCDEVERQLQHEVGDLSNAADEEVAS